VNLLVVDDDQNYRDLLGEALRLQGHVVYTAADGEEAYHIVETRDIQFVISDIRMPGVNGLELLRSLRLDTRFRDLPFVSISGYIDNRLGSKVIKNPNVDFYLSKPLSLQLLLEVIREKAMGLGVQPA